MVEEGLGEEGCIRGERDGGLDSQNLQARGCRGGAGEEGEGGRGDVVRVDGTMLPVRLVAPELRARVVGIAVVRGATRGDVEVRVLCCDESIEVLL